jgi:hypothetical protein
MVDSTNSLKNLAILICVVCSLNVIAQDECSPVFTNNYDDIQICGLEPLELSGAYTDSDPGSLLVYFSDSDCNFSEGSYLNITIYTEGAEPEVIELSMVDPCFWSNNSEQSIAIEVGDSIVVEYVASVEDNGNNNITLFNCGNQNMVYSESPQESGLLWTGFAGCPIDPWLGSWSICTGPSGSFDQNGSFDAEFEPSEFGIYELCFNSECDDSVYVFQVEWQDDLDASLWIPPSADDLCPGQEAELIMQLDNNSGTYTIVWPGEEPSDSLSYLLIHGELENGEQAVTIGNSCGTQEFLFEVYSHLWVEIDFPEEVVMCDGGSVVVLDPIEVDDPNLQYQWSGTPSIDSVEESVEVSELGTYCVEVSGQCNEEDDCVEVVAFFLEDPNSQYETCLDEITIDLGDFVSASVSAIWCDGSSGLQYTASSEGECCVELFYDACDTITHCIEIMLDVPVDVSTIEGDDQIEFGDTYEFTYSGQPNSTYEWTIDGCGSILTEDNGTVEVEWEDEGGCTPELCVTETTEEGCIGEEVCLELALDIHEMGNSCEIEAMYFGPGGSLNIKPGSCAIERIEIIDSFGRIVLVSSFETEINLPDLLKGLYFIRLDGAVFKLIK